MGFKEGHNSAEAEPQCFGSTKLYTSVNLTGESLTVRIAPDKEFVAVGECNGIIQVWEARPAVATDTKKPLSDMGKPLSQVAQEVGSPPTQVYVARIATDQQFMIFAGTNANLVKFVNSTTLRTVGLVSNLSNGVYSADCCADPEDRKRFIVAFTNRLKVYLLLVDPRQPTLAEAPVPV
ncbi:hypothetical protein D915_007748 [Fasciola hepatica]|uniref:WD domain, G-beta repeat protein n=1 Tax=Fasciola hepatica TaxID=6192 RepID=A0A4E0RLD2_FASHE|nr:hypothetical protein D915_007748 [Fasciola hepatica]